MEKPRRFLLYGFGLVIGCIIVYFSLFKDKNRTDWLPKNRIKDLILKSELIYSVHAKCIMKCRNLSEKDVTNIITSGNVNLSESNVHETPCPTYAIEGKLENEKKIRVLITTIDSVAEVETAIDLSQPTDTCNCK